MLVIVIIIIFFLFMISTNAQLGQKKELIIINLIIGF